ncbi:hypothetical protein [Roseivirga sp. E12]|uniref:hypothetical protein n=1 Tax=Roseivirga sp. E12 TaxID=2819237 RepID=UPI001ABC2F18|nr:hypothetical protein [Roseivirga sp. E12]MBO3697277.1 hypothetical protein [Roseivirga sp. E12]
MKSVLSNPIIVVILGFPVLVLILIHISTSSQIHFISDQLLQSTGLFVCVILIIFVATSFKKTRFLGEPQRYIEFLSPLIAVLGVLLFSDYPYLLWASISLGVGFSLIQVVVFWKFKEVTSGARKFVNVRVFDSLIDELCSKQNIDQQNQRLLSNDSHLVKLLLNGKRKVFWGPAISNEIGNYSYQEIFTYPYLNEQLIPYLVKEFKINFLILDLELISDYQWITHNSVYKLKLRHELPGIKLFQVELL